MDELSLILEALIFVSDAPLTRKSISELLPEHSKLEIDSALARLKAFHETSERSFMLHEVAEGFQFRTKPEFKSWILRLRKAAPPRITRFALETLAVVAYKQPVTRAEVERIRGVDVSHILKSLLEKNLVRIIGRKKDVAGKPLIYGTTQKFLEIFDLKDVSSLPSLREIKSIHKSDEQQTSNLFERPVLHREEQEEEKA